MLEWRPTPMGVALVHIGLPKTGTTSLQDSWRRHPGVCLAYGGLLPLIEAARCFGRRESPSDEICCGTEQPLEPGQQVVFSHEALSLAYLSEREPREAQQRFQEAAAVLMARVAPGARVLLTTRDPERWLRSLYNQAVKQGEVETMDRFLESEREGLLQAADIVGLRAIWQRQFGADAVLTLPMELMVEDPARFHATLADFAGLPPQVDATPPPTSNVSLDPDGLRVMRGFNRWVDLLTREGVYQDDPPPQVQQALAVVRIALRHNLEACPPRLAELLERAAAELPDDGSRDSLAGHPLLAEITRRFAAGLDDSPFASFAERYRGGRAAAA